MSAGRIVVFVVVSLVVLGGINAQILRWAGAAWDLSPNVRRALRWAMGLTIAGAAFGRIASHFWSGAWLGPTIAVTSTVQLALAVSGILLLLADASRLPSRLLARLRPVPSATVASATATIAGADAAAASAPGAGLPRRAFLVQATAGSALLVGTGSSLYGALRGRYDYSVEEIVVRVPGLPRALDGFSIAQLSDVHVGVFVGDAELAIAETLLRKAKPDLIVLTGDLLDSDPRLAPRLGRFVRRLPSLAREGVVAITGNHDYFAGADVVATTITAAGARMLRNDARLVGDGEASFALLGVDDVWARREGGGPDLERALASLPRIGGRVAPAADLPRILLCHNPSFFAEAAGRVALQLSGHTHGGQINLGFRPADYVLPGGWVAGRYDLRGSALYVNRGFGTVGPPARIGAPPEVTRIILTS